LAALVTFAYVGYVWALIGCCSIALFVGVVAAALHLIGRRVDRAAPRVDVEPIPLRPPAKPPGEGP